MARDDLSTDLEVLVNSLVRLSILGSAALILAGPSVVIFLTWLRHWNSFWGSVKNANTSSIGRWMLTLCLADGICSSLSFGLPARVPPPSRMILDPRAGVHAHGTYHIDALHVRHPQAPRDDLAAALARRDGRLPDLRDDRLPPPLAHDGSPPPVQP